MQENLRESFQAMRRLYDKFEVVLQRSKRADVEQEVLVTENCVKISEQLRVMEFLEKVEEMERIMDDINLGLREGKDKVETKQDGALSSDIESETDSRVCT